jgi:tetratricopeptide (TPR) repeat protein
MAIGKYCLICLLLSVAGLYALGTTAAHAQATPRLKNASQESQDGARKNILIDADVLIKGGKAAAAYDLLKPHQSERAGEPAYDYLLGIAALDSGKPNEAIFALERVLAMEPGHLQARAEIARAYWLTGEIAASRQEFATVQQQTPPGEVRANIQKYLDLIGTARSAPSTTIRGYAEAIFGDDSNVNSATASSQIALPAFGGALLNLPASGIRNDDTFGGIAAGFNVRSPLNARWALVGAANANQRRNSSQSRFNTGSLDGSFGSNYVDGSNNYQALLQLHSFSLDQQRYRGAVGVTGQWERNLNSSSQASAYAQYTYLSYPGQSVRNVDRYVLGGAYVRALDGRYTPVVYGGAYAGTEQERATSRSDIGDNLFGARLGGELKISPQATLLGSTSLEMRRYGGQDPTFMTTRRDTQYDLRVAVDYAPAAKWTISPAVSYTRNSSNIILNDYDRTVLSISVRRDFNSARGE